MFMEKYYTIYTVLLTIMLIIPTDIGSIRLYFYWLNKEIISVKYITFTAFLYKCCITITLMFHKELTSIINNNKSNQMNTWFVITDILTILAINLRRTTVMDVMTYQSWLSKKGYLIWKLSQKIHLCLWLRHIQFLDSIGKNSGLYLKDLSQKITLSTWCHITAKNNLSRKYYIFDQQRCQLSVTNHIKRL